MKRWLVTRSARAGLFLFLVLDAMGFACASDSWNATMRTGTRIEPQHFQFAEIVPEKELGGWRAVCIRAKVGQRVARPPRPQEAHLICGVEVGVPISNQEQGYIGLRHAQQVSAKIANEVAYAVLEKAEGLFSAEICRQIILGINFAIGEVIYGATATDCGVTRSNPHVPVVDWP